MWDSPRDLNTVSSLIFSLVAVFAIYSGIHWAAGLPVFALRKLDVEGMTRHLSRDQVKFIVGRRMRGTFFTVNLDGVRSDFEKLPWVRSVSVRRKWPYEIEVRLEEHVALARWGGDQLVNTYGEVFDASTDRVLPGFSGPSGSSAEVSREYSVFSKSLAPLGRHVARVDLSARRSWALQLDDGMVIELGRENMDRRLSDFAALYDRTVGKLAKRVDYVDLRYDNGFAVRIPGSKGAA